MYDFDPDAEAVKSLVGLSIAEVERDLILQTLCQTLGNRTHAADVLGISIRTMRNKLSAYEAEGVEVTPSSTVHNALEQDAVHAQTTKPKPEKATRLSTSPVSSTTTIQVNGSARPSGLGRCDALDQS